MMRAKYLGRKNGGTVSATLSNRCLSHCATLVGLGDLLACTKRMFQVVVTHCNVSQRMHPTLL
ncbi:hypothetical protein CPB85DRAFT_1329727 [Mucidula mucida]|nr:hypothetical protein CPB85DRAFT_1331499 [Mucidula mucida]KAF8895074.1 hypothetical protein CPB85DRAFT_1329727 [Mucidula mucida]